MIKGHDIESVVPSDHLQLPTATKLIRAMECLSSPECGTCMYDLLSSREHFFCDSTHVADKTPVLYLSDNYSQAFLTMTSRNLPEQNSDWSVRYLVWCANRRSRGAIVCFYFFARQDRSRSLIP